MVQSEALLGQRKDMVGWVVVRGSSVDSIKTE